MSASILRVSGQWSENFSPPAPCSGTRVQLRAAPRKPVSPPPLNHHQASDGPVTHAPGETLDTTGREGGGGRREGDGKRQGMTVNVM